MGEIGLCEALLMLAGGVCLGLLIGIIVLGRRLHRLQRRFEQLVGRYDIPD